MNGSFRALLAADYGRDSLVGAPPPGNGGSAGGETSTEKGN